MRIYDEVKPYDENNLKYLYKIIPIKEGNEIQLEWTFLFVMIIMLNL